MSDTGIVREKIGDSIELQIEGLPSSIITPATQARAALELASHSITLGADLSAGILGGVRYAQLRIGDDLYKLSYSVIVVRPMLAAEVFKAAFDWIESKKVRGVLDASLADAALEQLRERFKLEISTLSGDATTEPSPPKRSSSSAKGK